MERYQMTGTFDFILRIATSDMEAYHLCIAISWLRFPTSLQCKVFLFCLKPGMILPIRFNKNDYCGKSSSNLF
ncbi:hypothetical protein [Mucilaginibacter jinjuensis]|uniref:hypothetical protein n=1 Tax=Mucilaginibacter jinjuensis TaxID=1176721 RepID=UPI003B5885C1